MGSVTRQSVGTITGQYIDWCTVGVDRGSERSLTEACSTLAPARRCEMTTRGLVTYNLRPGDEPANTTISGASLTFLVG